MGSEAIAGQPVRGRHLHRKRRSEHPIRPILKGGVKTLGAAVVLYTATVVGDLAKTEYLALKTGSVVSAPLVPSRGVSKPSVALHQQETRAASQPLRPIVPLDATGNLPARPNIASMHRTVRNVRLRWNVSVKSVKIIQGDPASLVASGSHSSTIGRSVERNDNLTLLVTAKTGVQSRVQVSIPPVPPAALSWFGSTEGNHVYITMDDGWYRDAGVLSLMRKYHVPITTFLIEDAAREDIGFWQQFVQAGGTIEDHTVSHPNLKHVSTKAGQSQWENPIKDYQTWFGTKPTIGRPPYGAVNKKVRAEAAAAGLHRLVMWSASFNPLKVHQPLQTWDGKPLRSGEIILLHWEPGVSQELSQVLSLCKSLGLTPAPLSSAFPANHSS